jgi:hypothetical protein
LQLVRQDVVIPEGIGFFVGKLLFSHFWHLSYHRLYNETAKQGRPETGPQPDTRIRTHNLQSARSPTVRGAIFPEGGARPEAQS